MTIPDTVSGLRAARGDWRRRHDHRRDIGSFPSRDAIAAIVDTLSAALYPRRLGHYRAPTAASEDDYVAAKLIAGLRDLEREVAAEIGYWQ